MNKKELDLLFKDFVNGDNLAFEAIYNYTYKSLFGYLLSLSKNYHLAEELTQNTYISLNDSLKNYQSNDASITYLFTIAKRQYVNYIRKNNKINYFENNDFMIEQSFDEHKEEDFILTSMLNNLESEERELVYLHIVKELKHKDIAKILELPLGTVLWRYNKAIKKLKKSLGDQYE